MIMLYESVKKTIHQHRMLKTGDTVVVALSGGPDSVCLLHVLLELSRDLGLRLHAAHLDHRFRGEESARDARFVRDLADSLGIPCTIEDQDVPAFCREQGLSPQEGARIVRYRFLETMADRIGAQRIAQGHTATDQAETVLMRLLRGAGMTGLSGIPPVRDRFIRPLLEVTREEVMAFLHDRKLPFVMDSSNLSTRYTRNRIRLELLPVLRQWNPRIVESLSEQAGLLRDEDALVHAIMTEEAKKVLTQEQGAVRIARGALNVLPAALQRRLLREALALIDPEAPVLSSIQTGEALEFIGTAASGRALHLPGGYELLREYDTFLLRPRQGEPGLSLPLSLPGMTRDERVPWEVETLITDHSRERELPAENYRWQAVFDYDKIRPPLFLRSRKEGDRFHPAGMGGRSKKLQDFFVDEKVPLSRRPSVPLVATESDVLWIVGMRTDDRFLPGPETKRLLTVTVREQQERKSE